MAVSRIETWDMMHAQHADEREWYCDAQSCAEFCRDVLDDCSQSRPRVWHFGCGTSTLGVALAEARECAVVNTDASSPAIARMAATYPQHAWRVDDARDGSYDRGPFDLVVDKGASPVGTQG